MATKYLQMLRRCTVSFRKKSPAIPKLLSFILTPYNSKLSMQFFTPFSASLTPTIVTVDNPDEAQKPKKP